METTPAGADRVRANTAPGINARIGQETSERLIEASRTRPEVIERRLAELRDEWDIERILQLEGAATGLATLILGMAVKKRWLLATGMVSSMLLLHALHGWYPLLPLFRRMGFRTRKEIAIERYALKALRGDFNDLATDGNSRARVDRALETVRA